MLVKRKGKKRQNSISHTDRWPLRLCRVCTSFNERATLESAPVNDEHTSARINEQVNYNSNRGEGYNNGRNNVVIVQRPCYFERPPSMTHRTGKRIMWIVPEQLRIIYI